MKRSDKPIRYHTHAERGLAQRAISKAQVSQVLRTPDQERMARREDARRFEKALSKTRRLAVIAIEGQSNSL